MDKLRAIQLFVRLAELGSFTRVAEQTKVSKSMISKEIRRLEEHLGARLLHRSTRNVRLTHIGEGYLQRAREILETLDDADNFIRQTQARPKGKLNINIPMALGITDLSKLFADFMQAYPEIELDLHLGDDDIDLVEQGFDLGFRASSQPIDSTYVGRPLAQFKYRVCASRNYIEQRPPIRLPSDLLTHDCFVYSYFKGKHIWPIAEGIAIKGRLRVNNTVFMMEAIKQGNGIGFIPDFVCREALAKGEVVELLENFSKPQLTLYVLYPARHFVPPQVVQCIKFVEQWFAEKYPV